MPTENAPADGILVVRVWREDDEFRARLTMESRDGTVTSTMVGSPDRALEAMKAWLLGTGGDPETRPDHAPHTGTDGGPPVGGIRS